MAHFVLEYSDNLETDDLSVPSLFEKLHTCAQDTGLFPLKGIRSRAYACSEYRLADGNPQHVFIHLTVLIGAGRSDTEKEQAAQRFFNELSSHVDHLFECGGVALSFEMKELEPVLKYNRNNIEQHLRDS